MSDSNWFHASSLTWCTRFFTELQASLASSEKSPWLDPCSALNLGVWIFMSQLCTYMFIYMNNREYVCVYMYIFSFYVWYLPKIGDFPNIQLRIPSIRKYRRLPLHGFIHHGSKACCLASSCNDLCRGNFIKNRTHTNQICCFFTDVSQMFPITVTFTFKQSRE
jgi:hypothetical protein